MGVIFHCPQEQNPPAIRCRSSLYLTFYPDLILKLWFLLLAKKSFFPSFKFRFKHPFWKSFYQHVIKYSHNSGLVMKTKSNGATWVGDVVPVRRIKLIFRPHNLLKQFGVRLVVERRVAAQSEVYTHTHTSLHTLYTSLLIKLLLTGASDLQDICDDPDRPAVHSFVVGFLVQNLGGWMGKETQNGSISGVKFAADQATLITQSCVSDGIINVEFIFPILAKIASNMLNPFPTLNIYVMDLLNTTSTLVFLA